MINWVISFVSGSCATQPVGSSTPRGRIISQSHRSEIICVGISAVFSSQLTHSYASPCRTATFVIRKPSAKVYTVVSLFPSSVCSVVKDNCANALPPYVKLNLGLFFRKSILNPPCYHKNSSVPKIHKPILIHCRAVIFSRKNSLAAKAVNKTLPPVTIGYSTVAGNSFAPTNCSR